MATPEAVTRQAARSAELMARDAAARGTGKPSGAADEARQADTAALKGQLAAANLRADRAEQRYNSLQGKYNVEVPKLTREVQSLREQLGTAGKAGAGSSATPAVGKLANEEALVTKYGQAWVDDMKSIAGTIAQGSVDEKLKGFAPPDGGARKSPAGSGGEDSFEEPDEDLITRYEAQLTGLVPNWKAQNDDPQFIGWLQQRDPMAGVARHTLLVRHHRAMDALKVAEIFKAFTEKREIGSASSAAPSVSPPDGGGAQDVERPGAGGAKVWSRADISQFYKDCALGVKYAGAAGAAERARMEKDIFAAQKEGRVQ